MAKRLPTTRETRVQSLGWEDLEKEMATHSSILAWKIPWTEEPGRLQYMGSQRVGHDGATSLSVRSTLDIYQQICTGEELYKCNDCGKAFWKKICLIEHQRFYSGNASLHVLNVENSLYTKMISSPVREFTWERGHMNAVNVGKPLPQSQGSRFINENIQERGPVDAANVGRLLPTC